MPLDLLALSLLVLIASIALLLRLRYGGASLPNEDAFLRHRPQQIDPARLPLPLTGLSDAGGFIPGETYLPAEISLLISAKMPAQSPSSESDIDELVSGLHVTTHTQSVDLTARLLWTISGILLVLGLIFLLVWILSIF